MRALVQTYLSQRVADGCASRWRVADVAVPDPRCLPRDRGRTKPVPLTEIHSQNTKQLADKEKETNGHG